MHATYGDRPCFLLRREVFIAFDEFISFRLLCLVDPELLILEFYEQRGAFSGSFQGERVSSSFDDVQTDMWIVGFDLIRARHVDYVVVFPPNQLSRFRDLNQAKRCK